jgi:hypothetical protein
MNSTACIYWLFIKQLWCLSCGKTVYLLENNPKWGFYLTLGKKFAITYSSRIVRVFKSKRLPTFLFDLTGQRIGDSPVIYLANHTITPLLHFQPMTCQKVKKYGL